jgi:hypothetical protein
LAGIVEDIPVRVRDFFVAVDFTVLDMDVDTRMPLFFGRPFLSTANANVDVGARVNRLNINGEKERFTFKPKVKQCSQVRMVDRKISNHVQEDEVAPTKPKMKAFNGRYRPKKETNKAKGEKKTESKNTPAKASPTSSPPKKTKKVWHVKRESSESSTPGPDESKIN